MVAGRNRRFEDCYPVTGQTSPRKVDQALLATLAGVAASASKMAHDIRLLSHLRELEEPFEKEQVGSSAMPYKRNPMRSERICALARHVIALAADPAHTAATQWLERTLDDSANKRLAVPDAYMAPRSWRRWQGRRGWWGRRRSRWTGSWPGRWRRCWGGMGRGVGGGGVRV